MESERSMVDPVVDGMVDDGGNINRSDTRTVRMIEERSLFRVNGKFVVGTVIHFHRDEDRDESDYGLCLGCGYFNECCKCGGG